MVLAICGRTSTLLSAVTVPVASSITVDVARLHRDQGDAHRRPARARCGGAGGARLGGREGGIALRCAAGQGEGGDGRGDDGHACDCQDERFSHNPGL